MQSIQQVFAISYIFVDIDSGQQNMRGLQNKNRGNFYPVGEAKFGEQSLVEINYSNSYSLNRLDISYKSASKSRDSEQQRSDEYLNSCQISQNYLLQNPGQFVAIQQQYPLISSFQSINSRQQQPWQKYLNLNQISKYDSFYAIQQNSPSNSYSFNNSHSRNSSSSLNQSGIHFDIFDQLQALQMSHISNLVENSPQLAQAVKIKIADLKFANQQEFTYLKQQIFNKYQNSDLIIVKRFFSLTQNRKKLQGIIQTSENITYYSLDLSDLSHWDIPVDIPRLLSFHWQNLVILNLQNCSIQSEGLRILSKQIKNYPEIRKVFLGHNQIKQVQKSWLGRFKSMKKLFTLDLHDNPLNSKSKSQIQSFEYQNPNLILFNIPKIEGIQKKGKPSKPKNQILSSFQSKNQSFKSNSFMNNSNSRSIEESFLNQNKENENIIAQFEEKEDEGNEQKHDPFQLMEEQQRNEVIRILPSSYSPKKIQIAVKGLFRYFESKDFASICTFFIDPGSKAILFLLELGMNTGSLNKKWFMDKLLEIIHEIWAQQKQEIDILAMYQQINVSMDSLDVNFKKDEADFHRIKIGRYLLSELIRGSFHYYSKKNPKYNMDNAAKFSGQILNMFKLLTESLLRIGKQCPSNASEQTQDYIYTEKQKGWGQLISGSIEFVKFLSKFKKSEDERKNRKK